MAEVVQPRVTPGGVVTYNKGAVVQDTASQYVAKKTLFKSYQIVWYILGAVEILLLFRVLLLFLGANPGSGFARLVYAISYPFSAPFLGIFGNPRIGTSVLEWSTLLAMLVYYILAWGIVKLLQIAKPVTPEEVEQKIDYT